MSLPSPAEQQVLFALHSHSMTLADVRSHLPHDKTQAWVTEKLKCLEKKGFIKSRRLFHSRGTGTLHYYETELGREFYGFVQKYYRWASTSPGGLAPKVGS